MSKHINYLVQGEQAGSRRHATDITASLDINKRLFATMSYKGKSLIGPPHYEFWSAHRITHDSVHVSFPSFSKINLSVIMSALKSNRLRVPEGAVIRLINAISPESLMVIRQGFNK